MAVERVVLVDGSALLYRAFYALPSTLQTAAGVPTNATYGFATMCRKVFAGKHGRLGRQFHQPAQKYRFTRLASPMTRNRRFINYPFAPQRVKGNRNPVNLAPRDARLAKTVVDCLHG